MEPVAIEREFRMKLVAASGLMSVGAHLAL